MKTKTNLLVAGIFVTVFAICFEAPTSNADPLDTWHWRDAPPSLKDLYGVIYNGGKFVAVGDAGTIVVSAEGTKWTLSDSGSSARLRGVAYGGGMFLAVGAGGTLLSSPDAVNWTARDSGTTNDLDAVTYGQNLFVAVGANGTITTSRDGVVFVAKEGAVRDRLNLTSVVYLSGIVYGQGIFLGSLNGSWIFGSDNGGVDWWVGETTLLEHRSDILLKHVAYGNGRFVIVGEGFFNPDPIALPVILTSTNTIDWDQVADFDLLAGSLHAIAFGRGTFVSAGEVCFGCLEAVLLSSTDGTNWTFRHARASRNLYGIAFGGGTFVAVGESGAILQSDKIGPRLELLSATQPFAFNVIADPGENGRVEASTDLVTWTTLTNFASATGTNQFTDLAAPNFERRFYRAVTP